MKPCHIACFTILVFGCSSPEVETPTIPKAPSVSAGAGVLQTAYESAKAEYARDAGAKKEYVAATVAYATAVMKGDGPSKVKYPMALDLYAEALKIDPKNEEAVKNRDMILGIYESMGRKPPGQK
ncbi:MAG: hypothetical protein H0W86_02520 [Armatimonadetes bacterium]|nr:hypothetical protein [Armatimonadota bacterium]